MAVEAPAIRERLLQYVNGELGREDFERWFLEQTWELDLRENPGLRGLCGEIELCLAELSNGDWTEEELRGLLRPVALGVQ